MKTPTRPRRPLPFTEILEARQLFSQTPIFSVTTLVSNTTGAAHADVQLLNPWGISFDPGGEFWVSDNGSGVTTLYDGTGAKDSLVVTIPGVGGNISSPTGQIANDTGQFNISENGGALPALFLFATEDGTISGWNPSIDATNAITMVDHSATASYKGLAIASVNNAPELLAANFKAGTIDAFDARFQPIQLSATAFVDKRATKKFAPFNVQNLGGNIFVTYARPDATHHDDVGGPGHGFVDEFSPEGTLIRRFARGAFNNSPWGLAIAPATFDKYAGDLLVGNFKSGFISVYNPTNGKSLGFLKTSRTKKLQIDGLWALSIGSGGPTEGTNTLFFDAGPNDEANGLFGTIQISGFIQRPVNTGGGGGGIPGY